MRYSYLKGFGYRQITFYSDSDCLGTFCICPDGTSIAECFATGEKFNGAKGQSKTVYNAILHTIKERAVYSD